MSSGRSRAGTESRPSVLWVVEKKTIFVPVDRGMSRGHEQGAGGRRRRISRGTIRGRSRGMIRSRVRGKNRG